VEGGVSCKLVSEMPISLLAGKIQGISPIRSLPTPRRPRKRARNQSLMGQFPTHPNREFLAALQGIKSGDQGSFRRDQGIRFRPLFGLPPDDKSDRSKSRKPDLELDAGFCPCDRRARHAEIARRARRRERSAFRASRLAASVASRAASCTKLHRSRGTEGSNPSPSTDESSANLTSSPWRRRPQPAIPQEKEAVMATDIAFALAGLSSGRDHRREWSAVVPGC
jgi:hypothetical protein